MPSAKTRVRQGRAAEGRAAATLALREGRTLRVSDRTDAEAGTVHHGLAATLVRLGVAQYPPEPNREGWIDTTMIAARVAA